MGMNFKPYVWVLALVVAAGITGGTVRSVASPAMDAQGQDQDYSKNKNYQVGMREGKVDQAHNRDHFKKHHFKKDEDQKAYESGYQKGHNPDNQH